MSRSISPRFGVAGKVISGVGKTSVIASIGSFDYFACFQSKLFSKAQAKLKNNHQHNSSSMKIAMV